MLQPVGNQRGGKRTVRKLGTAGLAIAGLLIASSVASAQVCIVGIMAAAIYTSATEHRELSSKEATTCGLLHETPDPKLKKKKAGKKSTG
jgi:hypothetical protein